MQRMRQLISEVQASYPRDDFFESVCQRLRDSSQARAYYRAYDRAFSYLDSESWTELSRKALAHFRDHRPSQLKQGFFNQLNDAFAYQYLVRRGYSRVRVIREGKKITPDLSYFSGASQRFCEVKSVGISLEEASGRQSGKYVDRNSYVSLSKGFFNKLNTDLNQGQAQITSFGTTGLVFVVANFEDPTLTYYDMYRKQIVEFLALNSVPEVYIKVGVIGGRRIQKGSV